MSVDLVHAGGDDDRGEPFGIEDVRVASAEGRTEVGVEAQRATGGLGDLHNRSIVVEVVAGVVAAVVDLDDGTPGGGSLFEALNHVADLGVERIEVG